VLKILVLMQTALQQSSRRRTRGGDLLGATAHQTTGAVASDPWAGWVRHEHSTVER